MIGLSNVNNTSDLNKPVSTATTTQLNLKAKWFESHHIINLEIIKSKAR